MGAGGVHVWPRIVVGKLPHLAAGVHVEESGQQLHVQQDRRCALFLLPLQVHSAQAAVDGAAALQARQRKRKRATTAQRPRQERRRGALVD